MKAKTIYAAFLQCALLCAFYQTSVGQTSISGLVTEANNRPLAAATVLLLQKADSALVKGQLSSADGVYRFEEIPAGNYLIRIMMMGFTEYLSAPIALDGQSGVKALPAIALAEKAAQINEVQVIAKKPLFEQKIDRMVINVAQSSVNAGGNALQVLQRSPGILINKPSNMISMSGKEGVIIMINGKISRMPPDAILQMLESMNADNIERIELIHTPPASFDAEGNAGIINIVLKQSADDGLNGGYSLNAGEGKREKYGAGLNVNYRKKKINLFGSADYQYNHTRQTFDNYRGIQRDGNFLETDGTSARDPFIINKNARLGADIQISPKTVIGAVGTYFDRYWNLDAVNDIKYSTNQLIDHRVQMSTKEINRWNSATGNVNLTHQFTKEKTLTMDVDYVWYKINNPSDYNIHNLQPDGSTISIDNLRVRKETPIQIAVAKADYNQDLGKDNHFETGLKVSSSRFDNNVRVENLLQGTWVANPAQTSHFKLKEDVAAAYASLSVKANAKTDLKFGMRYEYTTTNLGSAEQPNVVDRKYGSWFPSAFILHKFSETQQLNLSYSRRIYRPGFTQLAPFLIFYDPTTVQSGNPALQPVFVNAIRADYRFKTFGLTAEVNQELPSIADLPFVDIATNSQVIRPVNIGKTNTAFAMLNFPLQPAKWWNMQNSIFAAWRSFEMDYEGKHLTVPTQFAGFNTTQSFTLPHSWSIDVSGNLITDNKYGLMRYKTNGTLNLGIQKDLGPTWGKLSLSIADIFISGNWIGSTDRPDLNLQVRTAYRESERVFMLTWTNKFGNKKLKDARQRERGASEEMRRL
jgi:hypothetical protein